MLKVLQTFLIRCRCDELTRNNNDVCFGAASDVWLLRSGHYICSSEDICFIHVYHFIYTSLYFPIPQSIYLSYCLYVNLSINLSFYLYNVAIDAITQRRANQPSPPSLHPLGTSGSNIYVDRKNVTSRGRPHLPPPPAVTRAVPPRPGLTCLEWLRGENAGGVWE